MDIHPDNTQSAFQVRLPKTLHLGHPFEVALVEVQYPVSWKTFVQPGSYAIKVSHREAVGYRQIFMPSGYYQNISELVTAINAALFFHFEIEEQDERAKFTVNKIEQKVQLETTENIRINLSNECCDALGLKHDTWYGGLTHAPFRHDISRGFHSLYIYCNICEEQIVGDVYAPLMRSVALNGKRGDHVIKSYGEPHYIPVNRRQVDSIEINIKDDTGHNVPFMFGKVICKLHFRPRTL